MIVDFIQKCVLLNISTADMYGSADPYQRAPRSPKRTTALSETSDGERCRSPSIDQVIYFCFNSIFPSCTNNYYEKKIIIIITELTVSKTTNNNNNYIDIIFTEGNNSILTQFRLRLDENIRSLPIIMQYYYNIASCIFCLQHLPTIGFRSAAALT